MMTQYDDFQELKCHCIGLQFCPNIFEGKDYSLLDVQNHVQQQLSKQRTTQYHRSPTIQLNPLSKENNVLSGINPQHVYSCDKEFIYILS
jgi:hypothetical protein